MFGDRTFGRAGGFFGLDNPILRASGHLTGAAVVVGGTPVLTLFAAGALSGDAVVGIGAPLTTVYAAATALGSATTAASAVLRYRAEGALLGDGSAAAAEAVLRTTGYAVAALGSGVVTQSGVPLFHFTGVAPATGSASVTAVGAIDETLFARLAAVGIGTAVVLVGSAARARSGGGLLVTSDPSHTARTDSRTFASTLRIP